MQVNLVPELCLSVIGIRVKEWVKRHGADVIGAGMGLSLYSLAEKEYATGEVVYA